jgi:serine/threonine protein kinase
MTEPQQQSGSGSGSGLPITPRSISKIVSLNDLRQLVRRMEEAPPAPPSPVSVLPARSDTREDALPGNGSANTNANAKASTISSGSGSGNGNGGDGWSDGVLKVVDVLGEGASGAVETVEDGRNGRRYARKTIATHEGPLKQLVRELAFLSGLRHAHVVRFHGAYMSPSNSEVKLVMELCEGRSLAAVGEQIRRRKGRVGEKVARVLAEGVCALFLFPPPPPLQPRFACTHVRSIIHLWEPPRSCKASRICIPRRSSTETSSPRTSSSRDRA